MNSSSFKMQSVTRHLAYFAITSLLLTIATGSCPDETWTPYKDEKCFKIVDQAVNIVDAFRICKSFAAEEYSPLLTIKSAEEQAFLANFIFNVSGIVDNVWLDAHRIGSTNEFQWNSNASPLRFTSWAPGFPSNSLDKTCVQMTSHLAKNQESTESRVDVDGLWTDVSCLPRNLIVCQTLQNLSVNQIQSILMDNRRQVEEMERNPVPVGFIYVQLPNKPEPRAIWPTVGWTDVSVDFAGMFFRTEGGDAAPFGEIQGQGSPRLNRVNIIDTEPAESLFNEVAIEAGIVSAPLRSGGTQGVDGRFTGIYFSVSADEVRPVNTAIKIWQRSS